MDCQLIAAPRASARRRRARAVAVAQPPHRAVPVVGDQERAVLHQHDVDRPPDVIVAVEEARHERLELGRDRVAVALEPHHDHIAADLVGLIPRAVPRHDDLVAVGAGERVAGIELHAERRRMRAHQLDRRSELLALAAPAELLVGDVALVAERRAEVLADLGHAVELVVGQVLRHPVAAVVGEVHLLRHRVPIEADRVADPLGDRLHARAVEVDAAHGAVALGRHAVVAGLSDLEVELVVGSDRQVLPAVRLVLRQA